MNVVQVDAGPDITEGFDYPNHAGWDLGENTRISYGQDGEDGDWVVYLSPHGVDDLYAVVTREQIVEHARQILYVCGERS